MLNVGEILVDLGQLSFSSADNLLASWISFIHLVWLWVRFVVWLGVGDCEIDLDLPGDAHLPISQLMRARSQFRP